MARRSILECSFEEYGTDITDNPSQFGMADQFLDELNNMDTLSGNIDHKFQDIDALMENGLGIERLITTLQEVGRVPNMTIIQWTLNHHLNDIGLEKVTTDFNTLSTEEILVTLEGFLDKIYHGVVDISLKAFKNMEDLFKGIFTSALAMATHAETLGATMTHIHGATSKEEYMKIHDGHFLHLGGKCSTESILQGYRNLTKLNLEVWPEYLKNLYEFYKNYFNTFQGLSKDIDKLEKNMEVNKVITKFLDDTQRDLEKVLNVGDSRLEISGGKIFTARKIVESGLYQLQDRDPKVKVRSAQSIKVPSQHEIGEMLQLVEENMHTVKSMWGKYREIDQLAGKARTSSAHEMRSKNEESLFKAMSRMKSRVEIGFYYPTLLKPMSELGKYTVSVSRSIIHLCERAAREYQIDHPNP